MKSSAYGMFVLVTSVLFLYQACSSNKNPTGDPTPNQEALPQYSYLGFQVFLSEGSPTLAVGGSQQVWTQNNPNGVGSIPLAAPPAKALLEPFIQDIINQIGTTGTGTRKLALIFGPLAFDQTDDQITQAVSDIFTMAIEHNVAVGFHIDDSKFWSRRSDLWQNSANIEWLSWDGTVNTGLSLAWGTPTIKLAPQMCFNSPQVIAAVKHLAHDVIGAAIKAGIDRLAMAGKPELFAGAIVGWESGLGLDYKTQQNTGFCSLTNLGYSQANPPANMATALTSVLHDFISLWAANLVEAGFPSQKLFGHVASISDLGVNAPAVAFSIPEAIFNDVNLNPGFSLYSSWVSPAQISDMYNNLQAVGSAQWALCEGTNLDTTESMETYLAKVYNHGGTLTNLFGWGLGTDPNMTFRYATENSSAIATYQKFLNGGSLE